MSNAFNTELETSVSPDALDTYLKTLSNSENAISEAEMLEAAKLGGALAKAGATSLATYLMQITTWSEERALEHKALPRGTPKKGETVTLSTASKAANVWLKRDPETVNAEGTDRNYRSEFNKFAELGTLRATSPTNLLKRTLAVRDSLNIRKSDEKAMYEVAKKVCKSKIDRAISDEEIAKFLTKTTEEKAFVADVKSVVRKWMGEKSNAPDVEENPTWKAAIDALQAFIREEEEEKEVETNVNNFTSDTGALAGLNKAGMVKRNKESLSINLKAMTDEQRAAIDKIMGVA